ncbi:hypothetical protein, partial [Microbacterium sp. C448]
MDIKRKNHPLNISAILDVLAPLAWVALVSLVALAGRAVGNDWMLFGGLWFALAVAAGLWASRQPWIVRTGNPIERRIGIGLSVALIPVLTYAIALLSGIALERVSSERYAAARSAFVADADGFPFLKKFALEHYGVHVVLSSAVSGWNTNTVALPHSIPALMYVGPGYCDLVLNPANVLKGFTGSDPTPWIKGVMVHELAHCLDVSRDMPSFTGRDIGTRSIAPGAAVSAVTLEQHLEAASRLPSQVWREALADSFTVGFWRMTEPSADQLITDLLEKRSSGDAAHYTSCWIEQAMQTPLPRSMPA